MNSGATCGGARRRGHWVAMLICALVLGQLAAGNAAELALARRPTAVALANGIAGTAAIELQGPAGTAVVLDGRESTDPNGRTLTYAWDFENDGKTDAKTVTATHLYPPGGPYTAKLTVTNTRGSSDTSTVTITVADHTPPRFTTESAPDEYGQPIEGAGSASFSWLRHPGCQLGVAFQAPRTGAITGITLQWKCSSGYGDGNLGTYRFTLQTDGPGHLPSGMAIATAGEITPASAMEGRIDGAFTVPITATLTAGEIYHLVIANTDSDPETNWSSPNTLMTRVQPWDGTGYRCAYLDLNGVWTPWSSVDNLFNTSGTNDVNGAHCPLMLSWQDGTVSGDPYYSAAMSTGAYLYGSSVAGEYIVWDRPDLTITRVGISVGKQGAPGSLLYHLTRVGGAELATGVITTAAGVSSLPTWVYATLPAPVTLQQGQRYRLWFASPTSSSQSSCYYQYIPYGETTPAAWLEAGWGGTQSYYTSSANGGSTWAARTTADLTFSLAAGGSALADVSVEQATPAGTVLTLTPPAVTDAVDPQPTVTSDAPACFPPGETVVTWTATDAAGNSATVTQRVLVRDTTPPQLTAPPDMSLVAVGVVAVPVSLTPPAATDNVDPQPAVTNDALPCCHVGTTVVTWTARDAAGNTATTTQRVTVTPTFGLAELSRSSINPLMGQRVALTALVPQPATVRVLVRNGAGQTIRTLLATTCGPGAYRLNWDGTDTLGRLVANGDYTLAVTGTVFGAVIPPAQAVVTVRYR